MIEFILLMCLKFESLFIDKMSSSVSLIIDKMFDFPMVNMFNYTAGANAALLANNKTLDSLFQWSTARVNGLES